MTSLVPTECTPKTNFDEQLKSGKVIRELVIDRVRNSGNCTSPHYYNARILPLGSCVLGIGE